MRAFNSSDNTTVIVQSGEGSAIESPPQTAMTTELGGALNELELTSNDSSFDAFERLSHGRQFIVGDWNPNSGAPALPSGYSDYKVGMRWRITDDGSWTGNSDLHAGVTNWEANDWATVDINGVLRAGDNVVLSSSNRDHYRGTWPEQGVNALTESTMPGDWWLVNKTSKINGSYEHAFLGDLIVFRGDAGYRKIDSETGRNLSNIIVYVSNNGGITALGNQNDPAHFYQALVLANKVPRYRKVIIRPLDGTLALNGNGWRLYRPVTIDEFDQIDIIANNFVTLHNGASLIFDGSDRDGNLNITRPMVRCEPDENQHLNINFVSTNIVRSGSGLVVDCNNGITGNITFSANCTLNGISVADDPDASSLFVNVPRHSSGAPRNILCNLSI